MQCWVLYRSNYDMLGSVRVLSRPMGQKTMSQSNSRVADECCISCIDKARAYVPPLIIVWFFLLSSPSFHHNLAICCARAMSVCKGRVYYTSAFTQTVGCPPFMFFFVLLVLLLCCLICTWKCRLCYTYYIAGSGYLIYLCLFARFYYLCGTYFSIVLLKWNTLKRMWVWQWWYSV